MINQLSNAEQYLEIARATNAIKARMERLAESFASHGRSPLDDAMLAVFVATANQIGVEAMALATSQPHAPPVTEPEPE